MKFGDRVTVGIHKSRLSLYELYDERTDNTSNSFKHFIRKCSKNVAVKARFINNKVEKSAIVVKMTWNIINRETERVKS